jgi:DNA-directed RNA polymerase subunit RPC12/RpoP
MIELTVYRCYDCKGIVTNYELLNNRGTCPRCSGKRVSGANPTFLELAALQIKVIYWTIKEKVCGKKD